MKYYWIKNRNKEIKEISRDKYNTWAFIKTNGHKLITITNSEITMTERGLHLAVKRDMLERILSLR